MENEKIIETVRALEKPSSRQKRLIELSDAKDLTPAETEIRDALFEAERTQIASRAAKEAAIKKMLSHSGKERRERNQYLIDIGILVNGLKLNNSDLATILGAIMEINDATPEMIAKWKAFGAPPVAELKRQRDEQKAKPFKKTGASKETKEAA